MKKVFQLPQQMGGTLIRKAIKTLRDAKIELPIREPVWIACSGGPDSVALAVLVLKYGRKIVSKPKLLHINHGWRPTDANLDEKFVIALAKKCKTSAKVIRLKSPLTIGHRGSIEALGRKERQKHFQELSQKKRQWVFTAHHRDDAAENALWKLLTGNQSNPSHHLAVLYKNQIRPFLGVSKKEIYAFLKEENQSYRIDSTNTHNGLLRNELRKLIPKIEQIFPQASQHLAELNGTKKIITQAKPNWFELSGIHLRRQHWTTLAKLLTKQRSKFDMPLPGGWVLQKKSPKKWVLERP